MGKWRKFNGELLHKSILEEVEEVLERENALNGKLKVCIGTDSQVRNGIIDFATVILFLRHRQGGFMYISQEKVRHSMSIKERMLMEVGRSIETAYNLCGLLERYNIKLEVHADINTNPQFKSNTALSEAMGYILSMGFEFKAKPEAFASSYCANKIVS
jgi:uncharacterized protein